MNINTITAYLLVSNTDAVELKQQLRSFDASEDMCKVISLLSEEWYVHKRLNNLFDYALLGVSPDKCVYHFENIRNSIFLSQIRLETLNMLKISRLYNTPIRVL